MQKIILNEKKYVEELIDSSSLPEDVSPNKMVSFLVKYYYSNGKSKNEIVELVQEHMNKYNLSIVDYEPYKAVSMIEKIYNKLNSGKLQTLREIDVVPLYSKEKEFIEKCESNREKKMLFTLFILARITDKYGWVYQQRSDLYKLANVSVTGIKKVNLIHELYKKELIKLTNKVDDNKIGVELIPEGDIVLEVKNIEHLGNQYMEFISDKKSKVCEGCGKLIKIKSKHDGSKKYCKECSKKAELENKRNWWNNRRK